MIDWEFAVAFGMLGSAIGLYVIVVGVIMTQAVIWMCRLRRSRQRKGNGKRVNKVIRTLHIMDLTRNEADAIIAFTRSRIRR